MIDVGEVPLLSRYPGFYNKSEQDMRSKWIHSSLAVLRFLLSGSCLEYVPWHAQWTVTEIMSVKQTTSSVCHGVYHGTREVTNTLNKLISVFVETSFKVEDLIHYGSNSFYGLGFSLCILAMEVSLF